MARDLIERSVGKKKQENLCRFDRVPFSHAGEEREKGGADERVPPVVRSKWLEGG